MKKTDKHPETKNKSGKIKNLFKNKDEHTNEAHEQADQDMEKDPDFKPNEDEDLDEGELARKQGHP